MNNKFEDVEVTIVREIDLKSTKRAIAYELWMKAPNPMVTFFKTIDVTNIIKLGKKRQKETVQILSDNLFSISSHTDGQSTCWQFFIKSTKGNQQFEIGKKKKQKSLKNFSAF